MIGSHDTFTYLKTNNILAKMFTMFWRCQEKSIQDQYKAGVRLFDIRVMYEKIEDKEWWRVGHGLAKVDQCFVNLNNICSYFKKEFPGSLIRIILESGCDDEYIVKRFETHAKKAVKSYSSILTQIIIKHPWKVLHTLNTFKEEHDYCCHLFNWDIDKSIIDNIKQFDISSWSIKSWAKKHNPSEITKEMIEDKDKLYFMDYVDIYPTIKY